MLARPGTPRDPKSHLFGTNRVAIQPFFKPKPGLYAEFRRGSRQIGPTPSISTFLLTIFFDPKTAQKLKTCDFLYVFEKTWKTAPAGLKWPSPRAPRALFMSFWRKKQKQIKIPASRPDRAQGPGPGTNGPSLGVLAEPGTPRVC